jgi:BirA family biotin operon repressor/biotin-[acetyl-CoA-carboxylase] ligase
LEALGDYLVAFNKEGFAPFKAEWNSWDAYQNQSVEITEGGKTQLSGIERGVSPEGALLIEELPGSVPKVIYAGDLSLHKRP